MANQTPWISNVFHADLSSAHPGETYYLHANGKSYDLLAHTPETRAQLKAAVPKLAATPDAQLTHYTKEPVLLPPDQVVRVHLKHTLDSFNLPNPTGAKGSYHSAIVLPPGAGEMATAAPPTDDTSAPPASVPSPPGSNPAAPVHHHINWVSTAQALIFHHSDLITHDPATAAVIFNYMNNQSDSAAIVQQINDLASAMAQMGPPTPVGAASPGWATLNPVAVTNPDSTATTYYRQDPDKTIISAAGDVMTAMMVATKNDMTLRNKKWTPQHGSTIISTPVTASAVASTPATVPPVSSTVPTAIGMTINDDAWAATLTVTGEQNGVLSSITVTAADTQTINLMMENHYLRWLGVYISFYDAGGTQIDISDWSSGAAVPGISDYENNYYRFIGYMQPQNSFMGIPIHGDPGLLSNGTSTEGDGEGISITFPSGAVSAKISACGLGTGGYPYGDAIVFGGVATGVCNIAIPALMIGFAVAAQTYKPLYKLLQNPKTLAAALFAGAGIFTYEFNSSAVHHRMNWHALSVLGQIVFLSGLTPVLAWMTTTIVEGEVTDEIPFVGWVATGLQIASDVAQMVETIVDVAMSPWFINNTVSLSITTAVTVNPDPRHTTWPQGQAGSTSTCVAKLIYKGQQRPTVSQTFTLPAGFTNLTIPFSFADNTLGGQVKVEADFYIDSWLAGKAQSGWIENNEQDAASLTLYLVELPKPITATSIFQHSSILIYDKTQGQYQWNPTAAVPGATIANLDTGSNGNEISVSAGLSLSQRHAVIAAAFKAAGTGLAPATGGGTNTQLYAMQSVDIPGTTMNDVKFLTAGFMEQSELLYDPFPPKFEMTNGQWVLNANNQPIPDPNDVNLGCYYIDPGKASIPLELGGGYHLRKVDVTGNTDFDTNPTTAPLSSGRFPFFPDHFCFHPSGHIVGINQKHGKIMVATIDHDGLADDAIPVAIVNGGKALNSEREGLLFRPIAAGCSYDGTVLILDQVYGVAQSEARLQAFDSLGRPTQCFVDANNNPTALLPLPSTVEGNNVVYLDLAVVGNKQATYMFVLYYTGSGNATSDYNVAIYKYADGDTTSEMSPVATTNTVPAARICVDMWNTLYTQNYQMVQDLSGNSAGPGTATTGPAGRTVTSISEWMLPVP